MGPLAGVRILDLTTVMMGPSATQGLAELGADVIKVEAPGGDPVRYIGPARHHGMGALFLNANGSKRSIVLDLKSEGGRAALLRLCEGADVLAYNIRPQAMARLGLGYDDVRAVRPDILYAGMFGYGQEGPYAARPAYDDLIQGAALLPFLIARAGDGTPRYVPAAIADRVVGLAAVGAISAALYHRQKTGEGQRLDVPMFETMVGLTLADHLGGLTFDPPLGEGGYQRLLSPERRPYRTRDGFICALVYNDKQWKSFYEATGRADEFGSDPRLVSIKTRTEHIDALYAEVAAIFRERSTAEWMDLLERADIPFVPVHDFGSILEDPQVQAVNLLPVVDHPSEGRIRKIQPATRWSKTQAVPHRPAPRLGEHTRALLAEVGFSDGEIDRLAAEGAIGLG
ncbi:CaiB/BaiF CoA transferase family protein [Phreatobacter oligotrophus]|uniref:CaiB/BaiF CoA transferase family protein n=1 Tax=Phreatobacter oligotrophus TaxID=1122261 RepID=UPI002355FD6C|nr:CoA transferase [Phreatobacter oligotrophus]MBX9992708.1 CoA transferase [Phreatobacter oligotrophus]